MKPITFIALLAMILAGGYLMYWSRHCVLLRFSDVPDMVAASFEKEDIRRVAFLYDESLCTVCPSGSAIDILSEGDVLFVVHDGFSEFDIENFVLAFQVEGPIVTCDDQVATYLKRTFRCSKKESWRHNLYLEFDASGKIVNREIF